MPSGANLLPPEMIVMVIAYLTHLDHKQLSCANIHSETRRRLLSSTVCFRFSENGLDELGCFSESAVDEVVLFKYAVVELVDLV